MYFANISPNNLVPSKYSELSEREYKEDTYNALVQTIRQFGIQNPIDVVPIENTEKYLVVDGHHRLEAAIQLGMEEVPCSVKNTLEKSGDELEKFLVALNIITNTTRVNPSRAELSSAYTLLFKIAKLETDQDRNKALKKLGVSDKELKWFYCFNSLDAETKSFIEKNDISDNSQVLELLRKLDKDSRLYYLNMAVEEGYGKKEYPEFLKRACMLDAKLPRGMQTKFNKEGLPLVESVIEMFARYGQDEETMFELAKKLRGNNLSKREIVDLSQVYTAIIDNCPNIAPEIPKEYFPIDIGKVKVIAEATHNFATEPDKCEYLANYFIHSSDTDSAEVMRVKFDNVMKYLVHYDPKLQELFWSGKLPIYSGVFKVINDVMPEEWNTNTRYKILSEEAYPGIQPDVLVDRLKKVIAERVKDSTYLAGVIGMDPVAAADTESLSKALFGECERENYADEENNADEPDGYESEEYSINTTQNLQKAADTMPTGIKATLPEKPLTTVEQQYQSYAKAIKEYNQGTRESTVRLEAWFNDSQHRLISCDELNKCLDMICELCFKDRRTNSNLCAGCPVIALVEELSTVPLS